VAGPWGELTMGLLALQEHSKFAAAYQRGIKKADYWGLVSLLGLVSPPPAWVPPGSQVYSTAPESRS